MRSGYVAVIGRANAGKSTLINVLVGEKVSIVSPKPQTTRDRILGVLTGEDYQMVFVDTPGIYKARNALTDMMMRTTETSAKSVDFLLYVVDGHDGISEEDLSLMKKYKSLGLPMAIAYTKIDIMPKENIPLDMAKFSDSGLDLDVFPVSARKGRNVKNLKEFCLTAGDTVYCGAESDIKPGNTLPLANIPLGTFIYNIELTPGKGAQLVRSAGVFAQLIAKENGVAQVRLPSGEVRYIRLECKASIGQVGNIEHDTVKVGKAGKTRHKGIRPTVRGSVMNPCDHPHGGGEGKSPVGLPNPVTPWGKPALGYKTRSKKARTDKYIVRRRNAK